MAGFEIASIDDAAEEEEVEEALAEIFFATAVRKDFANLAEREAFQHRWLDRYFYRHRTTCFYARGPDRRPLGYVVACSVDVRRIPCFSDVPYFPAFADLLDRYPGHLHVNVAPARQGEGIGRALVDRAVVACRQEGAGGIHVVTAQAAPSAAFYSRCGFLEVARRNVSERVLVMLGVS
ncbi:MAG: GNAT family N-acetyltransferase [Hyphomicrobiaceae bacterium]